VERRVSRRLGILWRGPLDSCNYGCPYCPFAKRPAARATLDADRAAVERFTAWAIAATGWRLQILFTPYGEALIWPWYQDAMVALSRCDHVELVAIQSNGSGRLDFVERADRARLALWLTWHPSEIARTAFVAKVAALHAAGTRLSVGLVAAPSRLDEAEALRRELPAAVPLWLNAEKPGVRFSDVDRARMRAIDPDADLELRRHRSRGLACRTGDEVISVDGGGAIRRCHFVDDVLGNLYQDDLAALLGPRPCPRGACDCWIGYAHLPALGVRERHEPDGFLARIRRQTP
jgi:hypothetical protein